MSTTFVRGENPLKADKLNTAFSERVSRGGDTMQGFLKLAADPVQAFDAATKQYVDRFTSMGVPTGAYIGSAPPGNVLGPLWWDNVSGQLFIQYNDGSSTQWVSANSVTADQLLASNLFLPLTGGTMTGTLSAYAITSNPGGGNVVPAYPVGNSLPTAEYTPANGVMAQLVSQSQSISQTNPEWTAVFGNWSTAGEASGAQKVAVYAGVVQSPGSGPVWSLNTLVTRGGTQGVNNTPGGPGNIGSGTPGTPGAIALGSVTIGYELDFNNYDQDLPIGSGFGVGMWINMLGSYAATAAIYMSNVNSNSLLNYGWHDGILFAGQYLIKDNTILDSTHSVFSYTDQGTHANASHFLNDTSPYALQISGTHATADIWVTDNAPTVLKVIGNHTNVVDVTGATISGAAWNGAFSAASINSTPIGSTTPAAGAFTTLSASSTVSGAGFTNRFAAPGPIGNTTPSTGAFTTLTTSGAVSGAGITALFAAPPAIGSTTPASGNFTQIVATQGGGGASSAMIAQASANASHGWYETGAAVDAKKWDALAGGGSLYFRILSDNEGTANTWLTLNRTGATPTSVSLNVPNIVLFGATAINGYITITLNIGAVYPPTAPFSAFGWNFLNGNGETDYWNNFTSATMAHTFWQRTGTSTSTRLADISPTGAVTAYGGFVVNAATGPTIRAGTGAATGTQPKGSLWLRTDGAAGSTLYVTQGGGTWAAVTGV